MHPVDIAALLLRAVLGVTMLAHGWNHAFGGGKIAGTTRWFASIGMRPAWVHAYVATVTEIGCGRAAPARPAHPAGGGGRPRHDAGRAGHRPHQERVLHLPARPGLRVRADDLRRGGGAGRNRRRLAVARPRGSATRSAAGLSYAVCLAAGVGGSALTLLTSWRPEAPVPAPATPGGRHRVDHDRLTAPSQDCRGASGGRETRAARHRPGSQSWLCDANGSPHTRSARITKPRASSTYTAATNQAAGRSTAPPRRRSPGEESGVSSAPPARSRRRPARRLTGGTRMSAEVTTAWPSPARGAPLPSWGASMPNGMASSGRRSG